MIRALAAAGALAGTVLATAVALCEPEKKAPEQPSAEEQKRMQKAAQARDAKAQKRAKILSTFLAHASVTLPVRLRSALCSARCLISSLGAWCLLAACCCDARTVRKP